MSESPGSETHPPAGPSFEALTPEQAAAEKEMLETIRDAAGDGSLKYGADEDLVNKLYNARRLAPEGQAMMEEVFLAAQTHRRVLDEVVASADERLTALAERTAQIRSGVGLDHMPGVASPKESVKESRTAARIQTPTVQSGTQENRERGA